MTPDAYLRGLDASGAPTDTQAVKRRDLLSRSEQRALDLLERSLLGESYRVYVLVPLRKLVQAEQSDDLSLEERRMLSLGEVDFLVVNREAGYAPAFAVEFDGHPSHRTPEGIARDRVKDGLLLRAGVPLVRVPDEALGEKEQITLLEWIVDCFRFRSRHREAVERRLDYWRDRVDGTYRETGKVVYVDAALAVHSLNPFPATLAIRERLRRQYGLRSFPKFADEDQSWDPADVATARRVDEWARQIREMLDAPLIIYDPSENHVDLEDDDDEPTVADLKRLDEYMLGVVRRAGGKPELLFEARAPIRWTQQSIPSQLLAANQTGTWMWAVDVALAQYLALADIERWAGRNLARIDR